jgi:ElaB/YqjD/DUF883 family membrane-anchored ribosome-binding protein
LLPTMFSRGLQIGWRRKKDQPKVREAARDAAEQVGKAADEAMRRVEADVQQALDRSKAAVQDLANRASEAGRQAAGRAGEFIDASFGGHGIRLRSRRQRRA